MQLTSTDVVLLRMLESHSQARNERIPHYASPANTPTHDVPIGGDVRTRQEAVQGVAMGNSGPFKENNLSSSC